MQGVDLVFLNKSSKSFAGASSSFFFCFRAGEVKKYNKFKIVMHKMPILNHQDN
jgi:hypothetical protein